MMRSAARRPKPPIMPMTKAHKAAGAVARFQNTPKPNNTAMAGER